MTRERHQIPCGQTTNTTTSREHLQGTPRAQSVSGQEWTGVDTLTSDRENMRNLMCGESDSVPYKERVGGSSPSTPTRASCEGLPRGRFLLQPDCRSSRAP